MQKHTFHCQIGPELLDSFGHVNNASYLILYEDARWDMISAAGYGPEKIQETGLGPTILELNVRFKRELLAGDSIDIESVCYPPEKKLMTIEQTILREGMLCSSATFLIGLFDLNNRKLVQPTKDWLNAVLGS